MLHTHTHARDVLEKRASERRWYPREGDTVVVKGLGGWKGREKGGEMRCQRYVPRDLNASHADDPAHSSPSLKSFFVCVVFAG